MRCFLPGILLSLLLAAPAASQDGPPHLEVITEPADASVFVRYTTKGQAEEKFLGRTPKNASLELDLDRAGPAEVVIFKTGFVAKVQTLELRQGSESRLEVRLTKDVLIPRSLQLKNSPPFVRDAQEFDEIYTAVLFSAARFYVEEKDPRDLIESSVTTLVKILNAIRSREVLLQRELPPSARLRYYGEELDLRAYSVLRLQRGDDVDGKRSYSLAAGKIAIQGATNADDLDSYLTMLHKVCAFLRHKWDTQRLLSDAVLARCAIEGLLEELGDEHTHFMTPDDVDAMSVDTSGSFGGIGVVVSTRNGALTVIAPMGGGPGQRAGILAGDVITAIDRVATGRISMQEAVGKMRGKIGTPVELRLQRGDRELTVTVIRATIEIKPTAHELIGEVGYLRISSFMHERLSELVSAAIADLTKRGAKALIIDLRNNPGGLLTQAHRIADFFVPEGVIVSTRTRLPHEARKLFADPETKKVKLPLAVLINGGSASASEILAGTLKEHSLATVIGQKSFGKGSVQRVLPLDPYRCALALTVATYHLPSGATPHKNGIAPDVLVELGEEQARRLVTRTNYTHDDDLANDPQMQEALKRLRAKLKR